MTKCPVCLRESEPSGFASLAKHLEAQADGSDSDHVRWLNQNVSRTKLGAPELTERLERFFDLKGAPLSEWIKRRFIARFYAEPAHPFVRALQHPSRATLLGYVVEHQHFLRQWVRSCAYIMARTDRPDVVLYELDNLNTEYGGTGATPAHYELLLRMGESLGVSREEILATAPLPATRAGIDGWNRIASTEPWPAALGAMHCLELIAHRDLVREGASSHYFDPGILQGTEISDAAKAFLREGYEADMGHAGQALALVERYAAELGVVPDVQAAVLRSIDLFDDYLIARLERGATFER
ncbi:MAG: iron-containing redox enzyme family protein [Thermoplasmata archaeon]|nr:iron-containing redox enzyme family protein [Thermoplasmata archaeon]